MRGSAKVVWNDIEYFRGSYRYEDWYFYVKPAWSTRRKRQRVVDPTLKAALNAADEQAHGASVRSAKARRQHMVEQQWQKEATLSLRVLARKIYQETVKRLRGDFADICRSYGLRCYTSQPTGVQWIRDAASGTDCPRGPWTPSPVFPRRHHVSPTPPRLP
jgi:hypothetical protein